MTIEEATKIQDIMNRYQAFQQELYAFDDLISGSIDEFTITTKNGSMTIPSKGIKSFGNAVLHEIHSRFGEQLDEIASELQDVPPTAKTQNEVTSNDRN